ncbi:RIN1 [Symbiodinium natans]|uniref:RIN1 protein n=1 Tax=Symbiodinium natans TaxID=878477 RepID=A0A812RJR6_9DINO|nr:RIN1 [Symbiodinium natans]
MRRRLEKWSQGWVTPSGRNQPRQRHTGSHVGSKSSLSSTSDAGTESVELSASSPTAQDADGFFVTAPPRMEAPPEHVEEMPVLVEEVLCCCHPRHGSLTQDAADAVFVPCKLRLSAEVLHFQGAGTDAVLAILLSKVTDVSVLGTAQLADRKMQDGDANVPRTQAAALSVVLPLLPGFPELAGLSCDVRRQGRHTREVAAMFNSNRVCGHEVQLCWVAVKLHLRSDDMPSAWELPPAYTFRQASLQPVRTTEQDRADG